MSQTPQPKPPPPPLPPPLTFMLEFPPMPPQTGAAGAAGAPSISVKRKNGVKIRRSGPSAAMSALESATSVLHVQQGIASSMASGQSALQSSNSPVTARHINAGPSSGNMMQKVRMTSQSTPPSPIRHGCDDPQRLYSGHTNDGCNKYCGFSPFSQCQPDNAWPHSCT